MTDPLRMNSVDRCACGNVGGSGACCEPYLRGERSPSTPEQLMRSRYTAFTRADADYLIRTSTVSMGSPAELALFCSEATWLGLTIESAAGNQVTFQAKYLDRDRLVTLHEKSAFAQIDGAWKYTGGETNLTHITIERNERCPCGSGRKFKQCHRR